MSTKKVSYKRGQAMLLAVVFFVLIATTVIFGIVTPILKQVRISRENAVSKQSYFLAQSALEDMVYRLKNGQTITSPAVLSANGGIVTTTITNTPTGKQIIAAANINNEIRKMQADLMLGTGTAFHYGMQAGNGGMVLKNSSTVTGNVFTSGSVRGAGNTISGDVVSAGGTGCISGDNDANKPGCIYTVHATGSAYAHTIQNSTIDTDAHYFSDKSGTTVKGVSYPNSPDQTVVDLPISDDQIGQWESDAASGGTVVCANGKYIINATVTIGPKKIPCNLEISGSPTVIIAGHIWVTGNITTKNSPIIKIASALGNQSVVIIADNPLDSSGSGIITVANTTSFQGSGVAGSFVFLVSQNNMAETTQDSTDAISIGNSASALVVYASHGQITLSNSVSLKEVTAYRIVLQNSANVTYDTGLANALFAAGPAGGYTILDWMEVP